MAHKKVGTFDSIDVQVGHQLKMARELGRKTQADMSKATGISKNHLSFLERGGSAASIRMLLSYCNELHMTPNDILLFKDVEIIPELKLQLAAMSETQQKRLLELIRIANL